ncbi:hypothetical protein EC957_004271 [Mortierella hygrophila]|uniref:Cyclin-domain-containing protein n=1 Tax=Mortierella hygrophila TaxID=979708 RepID=A0A9P6K6J0_9FUNG|nr:hypothetical protein EC957_004271 [Mortierella hygrophila]
MPPMQYSSARTSMAINVISPLTMDQMGSTGSTYNSMGHLPTVDPTTHANVNYSSGQYHSVSTTPVAHHNQQYQQQQQQQQYMPVQTQGQTQPHLQHMLHQQHQHGQQQLQQQLQQPPPNIQHLSHSHSYKQQPQSQSQSQSQSMAQPIYMQPTQQQLQHHLKTQQQVQQPVQQVQQRQQLSGPIVVTSHPGHQVQVQMQPHAHQQLHHHSSVKTTSQPHQQQQQHQQQHYQQQYQQQQLLQLQQQQHQQLQQQQHQHQLQKQQQQQKQAQKQAQQQREHSRDHRNGAMEHVINPQTSTLQLAEFASVMVYTLWHTRPNINGASSNAYNVVPHRISVPPSAGPAFRKFCLKVLSATQLSSSVILLSLKYIQKLLKNNPSIHGQQGSEFRLFTVSLMLANKFLDDNTFTNKTWSDVTGISVKEINVMEMEFLNQVQFSLYVSEAEYLDWLHSLETWLKQQGQAQPQGSN